MLKLHEQIDAKFESLLTDNQETDDIFHRATAEKTAKKKMLQEVINMKEAIISHDEARLTSKQATGPLKEKRHEKVLLKELDKYSKQFRPHNLEL